MIRHGLGAFFTASVLSLVLASGAYAKKPVTVSCGETITADTKLANDLTDCPEHGIVIGADDITLDLNGHTVDGALAGDFNGIDNTAGHEGVTVENGSVREFVEGVFILGTTDNRVRGVTTSHQLHAGILVAESTNVRVERNSSIDNIAGIVVAEVSDVSVEHNTVSGSEFGGIPVFRSEHVLIAENSVTGSGAAGIGLIGSDNSRVERNEASNSPAGIVLEDGSAGNVVVGNEATGNAFDGVALDRAHDNLVTNNLLRGNGVTGVFVLGSDDNRIEKNSVIGNGDGSEAGIHLVVPPDEPGLTANRNVISKNAVVGNEGDGILVAADQDQNVIDGNTARENTDDGLDVESATTTLSKNTANENHDLGIEAVPGVTDGGGNRASGNGNPLQCSNVFCR